jgi:hypothetical protein
VTDISVNGYGPFMKGTFLRAPGTQQALFASEQTIDALAHAAAVDPVAFRIQNIDTADGARWIAVLDAVAQAAGWKPMLAAFRQRLAICHVRSSSARGPGRSRGHRTPPGDPDTGPLDTRATSSTPSTCGSTSSSPGCA